VTSFNSITAKPKHQAPPKVDVPQNGFGDTPPSRLTVWLMRGIRVMDAIAKFKMRCKYWHHRNLSRSYTIKRTCDGEERYYCHRHGMHPWVFNQRLSTGMLRGWAAWQVGLMMQVQDEFKYEVLEIKPLK